MLRLHHPAASGRAKRSASGREPAGGRLGPSAGPRAGPAPGPGRCEGARLRETLLKIARRLALRLTKTTAIAIFARYRCESQLPLAKPALPCRGVGAAPLCSIPGDVRLTRNPPRAEHRQVSAAPDGSACQGLVKAADQPRPSGALLDLTTARPKGYVTSENTSPP